MFDILNNPKAKNDAIKWVENDFAKLKNIDLLNQNDTCKQCCILIAVDVNPINAISTTGYGRFIKYKGKINTFMKYRDNYNRFVDSTNLIKEIFTQPDYTLTGGAFETGRAFDCDVDIYYWIIMKSINQYSTIVVTTST